MGDVKLAEEQYSYSGDEIAIDFKNVSASPDPNVNFSINLGAKFREEVTPIFDPEIGIVIGYRGRGTVWNVYDLEGNFVTMEELPLETPLLDPIALIAGFGATVFFKSITRAAVSGATRKVVSGIGAAAASALRRALAKLASGTALNFTKTTARHMATTGRFVPVQILQLAIKYGTKVADPQKVKGAVMYTIKMSKQVGGKPGSPIFKEYTLEVVLREADNTVLHYLYK
jgi:hypothetical protein